MSVAMTMSSLSDDSSDNEDFDLSILNDGENPFPDNVNPTSTLLPTYHPILNPIPTFLLHRIDFLD